MRPRFAHTRNYCINYSIHRCKNAVFELVASSKFHSITRADIIITCLTAELGEIDWFYLGDRKEQ